MGRANSCALPGVIVVPEYFVRRHTFLGHNSFQRRKPMAVIGLAGIGVTGRLRLLDLCTKYRAPFSPSKETSRVECKRHRKGLRFPGLAEDRTLRILGNAGNRFRRATRSFRLNAWHVRAAPDKARTRRWKLSPLGQRPFPIAPRCRSTRC